MKLVRQVLFLLIVFQNSTLFGQAKIVYDLNDPRNPDCPCHKYQQEAEKEYANYKKSTLGNTLAETNKQIKVEDVKGLNATVEKSVMEHHKVLDSSGTKRPKAHPMFLKQRFRIKNKCKKRRKVKPNYAVCYRW